MRGGVKQAKLHYEILARQDGLSLARIRLETGRTHQIRVQFASRGLPLLGDGKYGSRCGRCTCALWSYRLSFPDGKGEAVFEAQPPASSRGRCFSDTMYSTKLSANSHRIFPFDCTHIPPRGCIHYLYSAMQEGLFMAVTRYFLGGNTASGFVSFYGSSAGGRRSFCG